MALLHIPLSEIDERQLQRLIDGRAPESRDIDYKRELYPKSDAGTDEWLADASSFANSSGGDIIFGMEEKDGMPIGFLPLDADIDQAILTLQQSATTSLQPRLPQLQFKRIAIAKGGEVLLVRIPRSYNPPHRVIREGKRRNKFYARYTGGRYEPDVDGLRSLFTLAPQLTDRLNGFRYDRVAKIAAQDAPVTLMTKEALIMHVVPFSAFDPGAIIPLEAVTQNPVSFPPMGSRSPSQWNVNFDGLLLKSNAQENATVQRAYTQLYRNGIIEAVVSSLTLGQPSDGIGLRLSSMQIEGSILLQLVRYLKGLRDLSVEPPFAVMISLIGVKGIKMNVGIKGHWHYDDYLSTLDRDQFHFGEVILNATPNSVQECGVMLKPFIEQLANTAGRATSSSFGPDGQYIHSFQM